MSSHHHHHHHHHHSCCCCCSSSNCCAAPPPLQPSNTCTSNADDLLQLLAANLLLQSSPPPPPSAHFLHPYLNPYLYRPQDDGISDERPLRRQHHRRKESTLHSLARRAAAFDSSFLSTPPPPPNHNHLSSPSPPQPPAVRSSPSFSRISLRELAARTIQVAFRRQLVRRSQTLRHLKDLAAIKSHAAALRSAASDEKCRDPEALSERALSLLHRLDAIQSGDPMIREGRRSISKELSRILDFVDKVLMKEHRLPPEAEQIEEANANGERALLEDSGRRAKSKEGSTKNSARKVRFFEEAMRSEAAFFGHHEPAIGDSSQTGDENDLVKSLARELTGAGASRGLTESNEFYQVSDDENSEDSAPEGTEGKHANSKGKHFQLQSGKSGLAAPMPVQMEAREV